MSTSDSSDLSSATAPRRLYPYSIALLAAVLLGSILCGAPAYAVTGGDPLSAWDNSSIAKIRVGELRRCSGAVVSDRWVLTLKSCLSIDGEAVNDGPPAHSVTVTVNDTLLPVTDVPVVEVVTRADRDVALLQLPVRTFSVGSTPKGSAPVAGETVQTVGYGRTATTWAPDKAQAGRVTIDAVSSTTFTTVDESGKVTLCKGDAGGPVIRPADDVSGSPVLLGIHAASWQGGCLGDSDTRRGSTEVRVDDLGSWIQDTVSRALPILARANGSYVTAENSGTSALIADRADLNYWALFEMVDMNDGYVAFRSHGNGMYVTAENAGASPLIANRTAVGVWEEFKVVEVPSGSQIFPRVPDSIALLARANGKYVSVGNGGTSPLTANSAAHGISELFRWGDDEVVHVQSSPASTTRHSASVTRPRSAELDQPAEDNGGSIVEDGAYPGAAAIEAARHIKLISGDGHIVLADCGTAPVDDVGVIQVWTTNPLIEPDANGEVCFKVLGSSGLLNLQVPAVYDIEGDGQKSGKGHQGNATVTTDDGAQKTVTLNPSGAVQVGVGTKPPGPSTTLLQLKITG